MFKRWKEKNLFVFFQTKPPLNFFVSGGAIVPTLWLGLLDSLQTKQTSVTPAPEQRTTCAVSTNKGN